jgi:serine/threonine-protein kinase
MLSNRYELGDTLGYGGMSEVHRGRDVRLGRDVAVKVLRADLARDPQFQERFRREAQNAAALNHPAIVAVYDTGEAQTEYGRLPYIVMEYVDGRTLRDIVKTEGPVGGKRAMEIMADVSAALDFSHRHGIVHRDVKPANVMITQTGAVKVMDFGIARAVHDGQAAVTQTAAVIGTAQYLSPEQARGEQVDARSDVYSAGCVIYELLTGQPPFTGDSPVAVAYQHVREDPHPPSSVNSAVTPDLDAIVLKALTKNPLNRYQSAAELRSDLVRVLSGQRPHAPMVMTDDDRTSMMTGTTSRHEPPEEYYDQYDYEAEEAEERRRRRNKAFKTAGIVAAVVALLGGAAWLATLLFGPNQNANMVAVPDGLVDVRSDVAAQQLRTANLVANIQQVRCQPGSDGGQAPCTQEDIGKVLRTSPVSGTQVPIQSRVTLYTGAAPESTQVPNLTGKSREQAEAALKQAKLALDPEVTERPADSQNMVGKVIGQDPPPGTSAKAGDQIKIAIGTEPVTAQLGDYTGQDYETAAQNVRNLGLIPQRSDIDSAEPVGTVVRQSPQSGEVDKNTNVTLYVSKGNEIQMPDLTGQSPEDAQSTLAAQGWSGSISQTSQPTTDTDQIGKVIATRPSAGGSLRKNQTVTLVIGELGIPSNGAPTPQNGGGYPGQSGG